MKTSVLIYSKRGFALISTLLFLPLALAILIYSVQLVFYTKVKNEILQDCFLHSLEKLERLESRDQLKMPQENAVSLNDLTGLNLTLLKKFETLAKHSPINFFVLVLKFAPIQNTNSKSSKEVLELATYLQIEVQSKNTKFNSFSQRFKCGAFLNWKDSKKNYGIIAVKY